MTAVDYIEDESLIPEENILVVLTNKGYIKRTTSDTFKSQNRGGVGIKGMSTNDEDFVEHEETIDGFAARVVQHECEHLEGKVFIDNISAIRRQLNKGKINSILKGTVKCSYRAKAVGK